MADGDFESCSGCGYFNSTAASFCYECGHSTKKATIRTDTQLCPSCNNHVNSACRFCTKCGASLKHDGGQAMFVGPPDPATAVKGIMKARTASAEADGSSQQAVQGAMAALGMNKGVPGWKAHPRGLSPSGGGLQRTPADSVPEVPTPTPTTPWSSASPPPH
eukprot:gene6492-6253_t